MTLNKIYHGDNLEIIKTFPDNSIDSIVTDPPYGIRMMGKAWDGDDIEKSANKRQQNGRTEKRIASGRKTVGIGDSAYAGQYDTSLKGNAAFERFTEEWARECIRVLKPGGHLVSFASTRTYHRMVCGIEDAGFEIRDQIAWVFASGFPKSHNLRGDHEGWGTALKPAYEPIVLARKPLAKGLTVAENVALWGTGAINIDATRIDFESDGDREGATFGTQTNIRGGKFNASRPSAGDVHAINVSANPKGRWPANFIHDGSAEVVGEFPDSDGQNGFVGPEFGEKKSVNTFGDYGPRNDFHQRNDSGSAARFFYCAKTSTAERNFGLDGFEERQQDHGRKKGNPGGANPRNRGLAPRKNNHPTVKPIALMIWLIKLITPASGTVLDLFSGSGTTACAAKIVGFNFVAIEKMPIKPGDDNYIAISQARVDWWTAKRWNDYQSGLKPKVQAVSKDQLELF